MNILYINDELATNDGSNYHALGILNNLKQTLGAASVRAFPAPIDGSSVQSNHNSFKLRERYKFLMQLIRIVRKTVLSYTRSIKLYRQLAQEQWAPDYVLARSVIFDTTAILTAKLFKAKLIYEVNTPMYYEHCVMNNLPFSKAIEHWEQKILFKADYIYTVSNVCRDMLCEHYRCTRDKFIVIPNGYMEELYQAASTSKEQIRTTVRAAENLTDKFVVTFIGSLKKWHGIDLLCQIADALENNSQIHFVVAGDGQEFGQIEQYCKTHHNMTYKGKLDLQEMSRYLFASDLGIMPYQKADNFYFSPLKMYDMIGAGLPFIGTAQGQIQEICTEFLNQDFLITDSCAASVCRQIECLASNPEKYQAMQSTLKTARKSMTWAARVDALLKQL